MNNNSLRAYWGRRWFGTAWILIGLALFLSIVHSLTGIEANGGKFFPIDEQVLKGLSALRSSSLNRIALLITTAGSGPFLTVLTLIIGLIYFIRKDRMAGLQLLIGAAGGGLINAGLKLFFHRIRPEIVSHLSDEKGFSFPSGHAAGAASIYFTLALILVERDRRSEFKAVYLSEAFFLVLLISFTRLYLGVHYPSDVLAGMLVGSSWAFFVATLAEEWKFRTKKLTSSPI
ncbi:MAG: phosphatase PAP2 family protein [Cryobacterium sp.]|nr:phosphatase PAP2 family protein [Oligoflexia bacterium]